MTNPFLPEPLIEEWTLNMWYVNRDVENEILPFLGQSMVMGKHTPVAKEHKQIVASHNFIVLGQGGSGKTTLAKYIHTNYYAHDKKYVIFISATPSSDLRFILTQTISQYLNAKPRKELQDFEIKLKAQLDVASCAKNIPLQVLENFFSYETCPHDVGNLVLLVDNAHFLLKDRFFKGFIVSKGFQSRFYIGLFMTPKAYQDLKNEDVDNVLDRFTKVTEIGRLTPEQVKEMIKKRLEYNNINMEKFLSDAQISLIHSSLNGSPRAIIFACRKLYDVYNHQNKIDDKDIAHALIDVRLDVLDYRDMDADSKKIFKVFMEKKGVVSTKELLEIDMKRSTLYAKLNAMEKANMIIKPLDEETGEELRGKWQLESTMSVLLHFGTNGEFVKKYEDQE